MKVVFNQVPLLVAHWILLFLRRKRRKGTLSEITRSSTKLQYKYIPCGPYLGYLELLKGAMYFTKMDLTYGFN